jgi:hypothetical protein
MGQTQAAVRAYEQAVTHRPEDALSHGSLAGLYRRLEEFELFDREIEIARELMAQESEYNRACLEAIAGEAERAVALLRIALEKRQVDLAWVRQDPDFDFVREHPLFQGLVNGVPNGSQGKSQQKPSVAAPSSEGTIDGQAETAATEDTIIA